MLLKKASLAATKKEESAHPLLRGAKNTVEGFEVHRAFFYIFFPDLCSTSKDLFFLCERTFRAVPTISTKVLKSINPSLMIVFH